MIENARDGKIKLRNVQANKCIDDTGDLKYDYYYIYKCNGNNKNQFFTFEEVHQRVDDTQQYNGGNWDDGFKCPKFEMSTDSGSKINQGAFLLKAKDIVENKS